MFQLETLWRVSYFHCWGMSDEEWFLGWKVEDPQLVLNHLLCKKSWNHAESRWRWAHISYTHKHTHTYICTYTYIYIYFIYIFMYIYIYIFIYICIYGLIQNIFLDGGRWASAIFMVGARQGSILGLFFVLDLHKWYTWRNSINM